MVKRLISLSLTAVILLSGCVYAESAAETETEQETKAYQLETKIRYLIDERVTLQTVDLADCELCLICDGRNLENQNAFADP